MSVKSFPVDKLGHLAQVAGCDVGDDDGLLLIKFDRATGAVMPYVLRLGTMTEGRLESSIMHVFNSIIRARGQETNRILRAEDAQRRAGQEAPEGDDDDV